MPFIFLGYVLWLQWLHLPKNSDSRPKKDAQLQVNTVTKIDCWLSWTNLLPSRGRAGDASRMRTSAVSAGFLARLSSAVLADCRPSKGKFLTKNAKSCFYRMKRIQICTFKLNHKNVFCKIEKLRDVRRQERSKEIFF
jgi:hypothetical protein